MSKHFPRKSGKLLRLILLAGLSAVLLLGLTMCTSSTGEAPVAEEAPPADAGEAEEAEAPAEEETMDEEAPADEAEAVGNAVLAIEHFSVIEGTTWSGAHDRAGKRIAEKYDNVDYVFREEVGPDLAVPYAEELIASDGATIVIGNAEFMGLPLADIAEQVPRCLFRIALSPATCQRTRNFIRLFPRQYQALYLEGLIAGALTETGNIGIVSAFPRRAGHPPPEWFYPRRAGCGRTAGQRREYLRQIRRRLVPAAGRTGHRRNADLPI